VTVKLRDYQQVVVDKIYGDWNNGAKHVCAVMPTGAGKSVVVSHIALQNYNLNMNQAIVAHRKELVGQMAGHLARQGIRHRIIASKETVSQITASQRVEFGKSFVNPTSSAAVVSIDTLLARSSVMRDWLPQVRTWTIDEAHHCIRTNKWGKLVELFPNAFGLGVTATPRRADGYGLGAHADGVFESIVIGPSMRELIDMGNLCDYEIVCPQSDLIVNEDDFAASGELSFKKGREASKKSHIVGDVVTNYLRYSIGKQCIVFATDVETSGEIAENFTKYGIKSVSVSAETDTAYRDQVIRDFRAGKIQVLVNVDLFGEGFDVPNVSTVIMARPTGSLAVYLQQAGRALRPLAGKSHGLIIDMVSNVKRHGLPDKLYYWSLDRAEKRGKAKPKDPEDIDLVICKSCTRPYLPITRACPHCGAEPPLPDPANRRPETVDGDLTLLTREMLAAIRKQAELESPADVAARTSMAAGSIAGKGAANRQIERIQVQADLNDTIAHWCGAQRVLGRADAEIYRRFYHATGTDIATALTLPRADMEKLNETVKGWS
jgi:DNA repair protein RadD